MHPEYPSAAAIVSSVGAALFESVFGTGPMPFTITDYANPSLTRVFGSAAQMAEEQREVRIWGGIHYRTSLVVSDEMGKKIAAYLLANTMRPVR